MNETVVQTYKTPIQVNKAVVQMNKTPIQVNKTVVQMNKTPIQVNKTVVQMNKTPIQMKNYTLLFFNVLLILLTSHENARSQISIKNHSNKNSGWTTNNPFKTDVFVENSGQFNDWAKTPSAIKYAINNSDKIFFTQQGLTFKLEKFEKMSKEKHEEMERKEKREESIPKTETYFVNMHWEGSNPNAIIEVNAPAEGYYSFGEEGYEKIKAKGYKKLTYKNLYPQIDVEYTIPEKGGIKYQLILHPGADLRV